MERKTHAITPQKEATAFSRFQGGDLQGQHVDIQVSFYCCSPFSFKITFDKLLSDQISSSDISLLITSKSEKNSIQTLHRNHDHMLRSSEKNLSGKEVYGLYLKSSVLFSGICFGCFNVFYVQNS